MYEYICIWIKYSSAGPISKVATRLGHCKDLEILNQIVEKICSVVVEFYNKNIVVMFEES